MVRQASAYFNILPKKKNLLFRCKLLIAYANQGLMYVHSHAHLLCYYVLSSACRKEKGGKNTHII